MTNPLHTPCNLDPEDWPATRQQAHRMLDDLFDHLESLRSGPVWKPMPDAVRESFDEALPFDATELEAVHADFLKLVLPYSTGNLHPGFMGWVHGGGNVAGMLGEMLAGGLNANLGGRDHAPIEVERQILRWVRQIFSFPETASGLFVTGTSMANFLGLLVARHSALEASGHTSQEGLVAYASTGVHGCIPRAMDMCGLGQRALRLIPTDALGRMRPDAFEAAIIEDHAAGLRPFFLVGNAGTVDTGAVDELATLAVIARQHGLWFHVDGAFGALAVLSSSRASLLTGLEQADSLAFDFHKWGQVPYDAGYLLVRDGMRHQAAFMAPAAYLQRETRGLAAGSPWPCDFGPDLSRGFRALKTWFTLRTHGLRRIGEMIDGTCALAQYLAERIEAEAELELMAPVALNIVCFRYRGDDSDTLNARIAVAVQLSGTAAPSTTRLGGELVLRAALVNHRTQVQDIEVLLEAVLAAGRQFSSENGA